MSSVDGNRNQLNTFKPLSIAPFLFDTTSILIPKLLGINNVIVTRNDIISTLICIRYCY